MRNDGVEEVGIEVRSINDRETWDWLVDNSTQGTVFSSFDWLMLYKTNVVNFDLKGVYENGTLIGGIAFMVNRGDAYSGMFPLTPYQGVMVAPQSNPEMKYTTLLSIHNKVADAIAKSDKDSVGGSRKIYNHYSFPDIRPFLWRGYTPDVKYTFVVDLTDMNEVWNGLEKDTRNVIRKADKEHKVRFGTMEEFVENYYHPMWMGKKKGMPVRRQFLERMSKSIPMDIILCDGSGVVMMYDNKRAYYILGASTGAGTSSLTLWKAFQLVKKRRVQRDRFSGR